MPAAIWDWSWYTAEDDNLIISWFILILNQFAEEISFLYEKEQHQETTSLLPIQELITGDPFYKTRNNDEHETEFNYMSCIH